MLCLRLCFYKERADQMGDKTIDFVEKVAAFILQWKRGKKGMKSWFLQKIKEILLILMSLSKHSY